MFLNLHSKFEKETTNLIGKFLMSISTMHHVQTFSKFLTVHYLKIYNSQTDWLIKVNIMHGENIII